MSIFRVKGHTRWSIDFQVNGRRYYFMSDTASAVVAKHLEHTWKTVLRAAAGSAETADMTFEQAAASYWHALPEIRQTKRLAYEVARITGILKEGRR